MKKRTVGVLVVLSVLLLTVPGTPLGELESISILAPMSFTSTSSENVFVIVSAPEDSEELTLTVNSGPRLLPQRSDGAIHHFRIRLALGLNLIELNGSLENGTGAEPLAIFRTSKIGMRIRSPFPRYVFHTGNSEEPCKKCHTVDSSTTDSSEESEAMKSMCLRCHNRLVAERYVHGPIAVGTCAVCHDASSEPNKYQLKQDSFDLCLLCHTQKAEALKTKRFTHGPLGAALCDICHEPHSSPNSAHLRQPSGEICMVCHKDIEGIYETKAYLHAPFKQRTCSKCHDAHYSDYGFLLKKEGDRVCRSCHEEVLAEHRHPVGVVPRAKLPFEASYGKMSELLCITCHNPHGEDGQHLLPGEGCLACHVM